MKNQFLGSAYVDYDRHVVTTALDEGLAKFSVGDTLGVSSNFHAGNLQSPKPAKVGKKAGFQKWGKKQPDKVSDQSDRNSSVPEGFPDDVCYAFNYKRCSSNSCSKKHVCRQCGGSHRAQGCFEKTKSN